MLLVLTLAALAGVLWERDAILASFQAIHSQSLMGPVRSRAADIRAIVRSLGQAAIVFGLGLVLTILARKRPHLAGSVALIVMTADLAAANARYVLTVPQSVFETKPEVLKIIEDAERAQPSPGPFRIHRMPIWNPLGWPTTASKDRNLRVRLVGARHDPAQVWNQPGSRIHAHAWGSPSSTTTIGTSTVFPGRFTARKSPSPWASSWRRKWCISRAGLTTCGTLAISSSRTGTEAGATKTAASRRSCSRRSGSTPRPSRFNKPEGGKEAEKSWIETSDFRVLRNLAEFPRAWVVHDARATLPFTGLSPETRKEAMEEILYAADPIWNWSDNTHRAYDPRQLAWVGRDDLPRDEPLPLRQDGQDRPRRSR